MHCYFKLLLLVVSMVTHREGAVESCLTSAAELVDKDPYQLTSHILDISRGIGAKNVKLRFTYYLLMLIFLSI